jgi:tetratricopeptide (TPR) repeat protein
MVFVKAFRSGEGSLLTRDRSYLGSEVHADGSGSSYSVAPNLRHASNKARYDRAIALYQSGHFVEAERAFREIVEDTPDELDALHSLGSALFMQRRFEESKQVFRLVLERNPALFQSRSALGAIARAEGRYRDAVDYYSAAIHDGPTDVVGYYGRGVSYLALKQYELAEGDLRRTLSLLPESAPLAVDAQKRLEEARAGAINRKAGIS